ncbi:MAG: cytosolic protein [Bacteroidetes bacterium]|nr:cytosolic protein [Bacteroidota bacterium]
MLSLINDVVKYVENNIPQFHKQRIGKIKTLKLTQVLKKKNPYLFKAKYLMTAEEIIKQLIEAYISSSEETMFGDWLEGLAIFINEKVFNGKKSGIPGIDLEFDNDGVRYIVSIKSGPNWGNSSQIKKMINDFTSAQKTLLTSNSKINIRCINGCCYGQNKNTNKGSYFKYCGQVFWEFIGGNENIYLDIIEPLGHKAKERNEEYMEQYTQMINKFTKEFVNMFCHNNGIIDWEKLVKFNSEKL